MGLLHSNYLLLRSNGSITTCNYCSNGSITTHNLGRKQVVIGSLLRITDPLNLQMLGVKLETPAPPQQPAPAPVVSSFFNLRLGQPYILIHTDT